MVAFCNYNEGMAYRSLILLLLTTTASAQELRGYIRLEANGKVYETETTMIDPGPIAYSRPVIARPIAPPPPVPVPVPIIDRPYRVRFTGRYGWPRYSRPANSHRSYINR